MKQCRARIIVSLMTAAVRRCFNAVSRTLFAPFGQLFSSFVAPAACCFIRARYEKRILFPTGLWTQRDQRVTGHALSDTLSQNSSFICQALVLSLYEGHITAIISSILKHFMCILFFPPMC